MSFAIHLCEKEYVKNGKGWKFVDANNKLIDRDEYENIVNSKKEFNRLGFKESHSKGYTFLGYIVTTIKTIYPDGLKKMVREFRVDSDKFFGLHNSDSLYKAN